MSTYAREFKIRRVYVRKPEKGGPTLERSREMHQWLNAYPATMWRWVWLESAETVGFYLFEDEMLAFEFKMFFG